MKTLTFSQFARLKGIITPFTDRAHVASKGDKVIIREDGAKFILCDPREWIKTYSTSQLRSMQYDSHMAIEQLRAIRNELRKRGI